MDATHLHLLANHIPILASVFSVFILGWGMLRGNKSFQQLAMVGFVVAGIFSIIALQSGEGAEDIVENLPGVTERYIHDHEEVAETTNWIAILLGVVSLAGLATLRGKPKISKVFLGIVLAGGLVSAGMFSYTAYLGGQIRHTEIRPDTTATQIQSGDEQTSSENENDH